MKEPVYSAFTAPWTIAPCQRWNAFTAYSAVYSPMHIMKTGQMIYVSLLSYVSVENAINR